MKDNFHYTHHRSYKTHSHSNTDSETNRIDHSKIYINCPDHKQNNSKPKIHPQPMKSDKHHSIKNNQNNKIYTLIHQNQNQHIEDLY